MQSGLSLGRIFGIEIRIDWSWLFIFLLVVWNLSASFSQSNPEWGMLVVIVTSVVAAVLFFVSVLLHELAHSLMAIRQGVSVRSITLFLFGGVSNIQREPPSPKAEFWITIVGPVTSFVLGALFLGVGAFSVDFSQMPQNSEAFMQSISPLSVVVLWLGSINLILALFNLIPGFPLDGGRLLRAALWSVTDDLRKATLWAARTGQSVAWLLIIAGIAMIFGVQVPFFGTGVVGGLWLAFIGWFLNGAAITSYKRTVIQDVLADVTVQQVMRHKPPTVAPTIPVDSFLHDYVMRSDDSAFPVVDNDQLLGIITMTDVRKISREQWRETTVRDIMTPFSDLITISPDDDAADSLKTLSQHDFRQLVVADGDRLKGLLRRRDVLKWLQIQTDINEGILPGRRAIGQGT
ncbi:MAG: M50 family metallopeptidase [Anaerolineae bacterium]